MDRQIELLKKEYFSINNRKRLLLAGLAVLVFLAIVWSLNVGPSAVDIKTEKAILDNLRQTRAGKTTLLIAHRVSTIQQMDKIIFVEEGKVIAVGDYAALYESCPEFKTLVDLQKLDDADESGNHSEKKEENGNA